MLLYVHQLVASFVCQYQTRYLMSLWELLPAGKDVDESGEGTKTVTLHDSKPEQKAERL